MKPLLKHCGSIIALIIPVIACSCNALSKEQIQNTKNRGVNIEMKDRNLGRFTVNIPKDMKQTGRSHRLRLAEIQEINWINNVSTRDRLWHDRVAEIKQLRAPQGKNSPIIERREFVGLGKWAKGIFYCDNYALDEEGKWEVLIDYGPVGIWLKTDSILNSKDNSDKMIRNLTNIAKAYAVKPSGDAYKYTHGDWFYLENGAINLSYKWEERIYARFEGLPLNLKLEIEMSETHVDEPENEGLLARTAAAIATGFASGVDIEKIRSHKRVLAGMKGEEQVVRMKDKDRTVLDFTWRFAGKKNSGEFPKIVMTMESPDGNLDEKLKIWDVILNSMKPLYRTLP